MTYKSYEELLQLGLSAVPDGYDKGPKSFIYPIISAVALIGHESILAIQDVDNQLDAENWYGGGMDTRVYDRTGLKRYEAVAATATLTFSGVPDTYIPQGFKVSDGVYTFTTDYGDTITEAGTVDITATATIKGYIGIVAAGTLTRLESNVVGVKAVTNSAESTGGRDVENDDDFLKRYYEYFAAAPVNNNPAEFKQWAMSVEGVGQARVIRADAVAGDVEVVITNDDYKPASADLVAAVKEYIEGVMGFDVNLIVSPATAKSINLEIMAHLEDPEEAEALAAEIKAEIDTQFKFYPDRTYQKSRVNLYELISIAQKYLSEIVSATWEYEGVTIDLADNEVPIIQSVEVSHYE